MGCGWCGGGGWMCAVCSKNPMLCRHYVYEDEQDFIGVVEVRRPCFVCGPKHERVRFAEELSYSHRPHAEDEL